MASRRRRLGILTGGGDCPGLNAVLRAVARRCGVRGVQVLGYRNGWEGMLARDSMVLDRDAVKGIIHLGGTILGTSRADPLRIESGVERLKETLRLDALEGVIAVGGDGTLSAAWELAQQDFPLVGVPKTIDNDLRGTDVTFGFDTAVSIATDAIDRLHSTAEAHKRVIVVEVMGNHTGWIALYAGVAGGADVILVPEHPFELEAVCETIVQRQRHGRPFSIVVVAEGAQPRDLDLVPQERRARIRPGEISFWLARRIEEHIDTETRAVVLGHVQRGGTPTAQDRMLATRFGVHAADLAMNGTWGKMSALQGKDVVAVSLGEAVGSLKPVDPVIWEMARTFT